MFEWALRGHVADESEPQMRAGFDHKYGFIPVIKEATALTAAEAGPYASQVMFTLPTHAPSGAYTGHMVVLGKDNTELGAIDLQFSVS
ncbi:hypothetical protein [Streptomyces sp. NPDC058583]|uniref:hypothetical protein n=1 Tax=unclassified Streptomyces TaxID=2593676 RepID=UPI003657AF0B